MDAVKIKEKDEKKEEKEEMKENEVKVETTETEEKVVIDHPEIVQGKKPKKRNIISRIAMATVKSIDFERLGDELIQNIIVPQVKSTVANVLKSSIDSVLFGRPIASGGSYSAVSSSSAINTGRTNYANSSNRGSVRQKTAKSVGYPGDLSIYYDSQEDAWKVVNSMQDLIGKNGYARVADYFMMSGLETTSIDFRFGWTDFEPNVTYTNDNRVRVVPNTPRQLNL